MISIVFQLAALALFVCYGCGIEHVSLGSVTLHTLGFGLAFWIASEMSGGGWSWKKKVQA